MACTANQYPHKTNRLSRCLRAALSISPLLGLVAQPGRKMGISIYIRVKDEADWIELSILSIQDFADEIIVVDNGSQDGTIEKIKRLQNKLKIPLALYEQPSLNFTDLNNFALVKTNFHWVMKWDGDFVAHTSGENNISGLRERLLALDSRRYYFIYLRLINLNGDLLHQDSREQVHIEEYIHTYSSKAVFIHTGTYEAIHTPKFYEVLFWYKPYIFHINVKPARKMLKRFFWNSWLKLEGTSPHPKFEDYVQSQLPETFGTDSWDEAQQACILRASEYCVRYNQELFGPYPDLLKEHLKNPKYTLLYDGDKITGRLESGSCP